MVTLDLTEAELCAIVDACFVVTDVLMDPQPANIAGDCRSAARKIRTHLDGDRPPCDAWRERAEKAEVEAEGFKRASEIWERLSGLWQRCAERSGGGAGAAKLQGCVGALEKLLECASLRGDGEPPHPADDPKLWSGRMQDAWNEAREALADIARPATEAGDDNAA